MITSSTVSTLLKSLRIGGIVVDPPLALAPMAGYTEYPFRRLCREMGGCGLVTTGLLSSQGIYYNDADSFRKFPFYPEEYPFAVQIYGCDPAMVAAAAVKVAARGANIVDINMGCAVPKLTRHGSGAGLLRDPDLAARVVEAVVGATGRSPLPIPVTVKIRIGWDETSINAVEVARVVEAAGAAAITVHGRTAAQKYEGRADWAIIGQVKAAVRIPVIGNGDVVSSADAAQLLAETDCDGVMIGRAAMGDPWIFRRIVHELTTGCPLPAPTPAERAAAALYHARLAVESSQCGEWRPVLELRKQLSRYILDLPNAAILRDQLVRVESLAGIESILAQAAASEPDEEKN